MTSKTQLQQEIQSLETKLQEFREQLGSYKTVSIENAEVGDTLEDGSIVLQKSNGMALLVSPASTEVEAKWTQEFPEVFKSLKKEGFNPSQWFVPTKEQLKLAYETISDVFPSAYYWSSTEDNAFFACWVRFTNGRANSITKPNTLCVRAFRCVTYQFN